MQDTELTEVAAAHATVGVELATDRAFALFTEGFDRWWPHENTFSGAEVLAVALTPESGWHERTGEGAAVSWGAVRVWAPPQRLVLAWQISPATQPWSPEPDPARASEVEVRFTPIEPGRTLVEVEHRDFGRHGPEGRDMAEAMASPLGWPALLEAYRAAALSA
jgi:uncharacterized protein YndB with AHSA1/START domain